MLRTKFYSQVESKRPTRSSASTIDQAKKVEVKKTGLKGPSVVASRNNRGKPVVKKSSSVSSLKNAATSSGRKNVFESNKQHQMFFLKPKVV